MAGTRPSKVDEDEEDDEDYDPSNDPEATKEEVDEDEVMMDAAPTTSHLSSIQVKAVDEAFERLFGYRYGQRFRLSRQLSAQEQLLVRILGPSKTASILRHGSGADVYRKPTRASSQSKAAIAASKQTKTTKTSTGSTSAKARTGDATTKSPRAKAPVRGGVDQLLKDMAGDGKQSTIAKTSEDWDHFKSDSGLGHKLEAQADSKTAYLNKQDFLNRVDHRRFEQERTERDRERAKRGK